LSTQNHLIIGPRFELSIENANNTKFILGHEGEVKGILVNFGSYMVKSAYNLLTTSKVCVNDRLNHVLWFTQISPKADIFIWRLFLNRLATKINMFRRNILDYNDSLCTTHYEIMED